MSMILTLAKIPAKIAENFEKNSDAAEAFILEGTQTDGVDYAQDVMEIDYRMYAEIAVAVAGGEDLEEQDTVLAKAAGIGIGTSTSFEFCYGPAVLLSEEEVAQVAQDLKDEGYFDDLEEDDDANLWAFFDGARKQNRKILVGVN